MPLREKLSVTTAVSALILLANIPKAEAASFYSVTELPFQPSDLNNIGQIVGEHYLWHQGNLTDLRNLPGTTTDLLQAKAINNYGVIVGTLYFESYKEQAFRSDGTSIAEIKPPSPDFCGGGDTCSNLLAGDINDREQTLLIGLRPPTTFRYGAYGLIQDKDRNFTRFLSGRYIHNLAIDNLGRAIANIAGAGARQTFLSHGENQTQLFPSEANTAYPFYVPATALDINDRSQVVGSGAIVSDLTKLFSSPTRAILWNNPENNPVGNDLGSLGGNPQNTGFIESEANSINNLTQIVGYSYTTTNLKHAFLWEKNTMFDLNNLIAHNLGWELTSALKINDRGQIIGYGYLNGQQRGFLLNPQAAPIPESTSGLSLLSLATLSIMMLPKSSQNRQKNR